MYSNGGNQILLTIKQTKLSKDSTPVYDTYIVWKL